MAGEDQVKRDVVEHGVSFEDGLLTRPRSQDRSAGSRPKTGMLDMLDSRRTLVGATSTAIAHG